MSRYNYDNKLAILIGVIALLGLIILSSAGVVEGQEKFGSSQYFLIHQILYGLIPGIILFVFASKLKYTFWRKISIVMLLGTIALLVLVLIPQLGFSVKGAQRWLRLGPISFQPSEFLKLGIIVYLAAWFSRRDDKMKDWTYSAAPFFLILGFISLLLIMQPDIGTLCMIFSIAIVMYFAAGAPLKHIMAIMVIIVIALSILVIVEPYRFDRIQTFFNPASDIQGKSYHLRQALLGIGNGGVFGVGFGKSIQKLDFLPEPVGDSIFAVLVEELGLVGGGILILLFLFLAMKMIKIAKNAPDTFSQLFVIGVFTWIIGQAFMNIAAISGLMPLTGIPLPLISFGGSALASVFLALGIVNNINKYTR